MEKKQLNDIIEGAIFTALSNMHTATIAKVTSVGQKTISCQPVITREVDSQSKPLPEFIEVPVVVLQGGGSYTAYPISVGDYCLLIVCERCFDRWWSGDDMQRPLEARMHDYSDGFAFVGVNNLSTAFTIPDVITQIGDTFQQGNYEHIGDVNHAGNLSQNGDSIINGNVSLTEDLYVGGNTNSNTFSSEGIPGITGTFPTGDGRVVTVTNGLITKVI